MKLLLDKFDEDSFKLHILWFLDDIPHFCLDFVLGLDFDLAYSKDKKHLYLVQNYETNFCSRGNYFRSIAGKTYSSIMNI